MANMDIAASDDAAKVLASLEALTRQGEDYIWRPAEKALALIKAQRTQNGALRTLNASLEQEIALHRERAQQYHIAVTTLDSEREANARLSAERDEIAAKARSWAANYTPSSDGWNTFTLFAEWVEARP